MMKLDKDLEELNKGATSGYTPHRDPALGRAQILNIQSIRNLENTIKELDKQNGKLNTRLFWLTVITTVVVILQGIEILKNLL